MPQFEGWADPAFERELASLSASERAKIVKDLAKLSDDPFASANVRAVEGSRWPGTIRLRSGAFRVIALVLPAPRVILFTVVFRKKRESDYLGAIGAHDKRVSAQGPPLDKFLRRR
ncbi:MAG TPA: hypothetical protein VM370_13265 [Candidatus Thermoplasmatota archaeon]|nr:hypothetical protein [Candidatus Thermoplasmatota archaeon]